MAVVGSNLRLPTCLQEREGGLPVLAQVLERVVVEEKVGTGDQSRRRRLQL